MAVITVLYEKQVEEVVEATKSAETCSASTLRLLRALLGIEDNVLKVREDRHTAQISKQRPKLPTATIKPSKSSKTRFNANFTILDCPEPPIQCLPRNKRLALATNTFNRTLKNLGDAVKRKQVASCQKPGGTRSPLKQTQGRVTDAPRIVSKKADSSQRSQSKSPELMRERAPSVPLSTDCSRLLAATECARTSLQCLRQLHAEGSPTRVEDGQVEQGALMLISKMQGLGFVASAIEETLTVRDALQQILRQQHQFSKTSTELDGRKSSGCLADCIEFVGFAGNAKTCGVVIAFQAQVLQLITVDDTSAIDETLLRKLDPGNPAGPFQKILVATERGWMSAEKAALQLRLLSQAVLSICSTPSRNSSSKSKQKVSPSVLFQLRCLALQLRCHWQRFSKHRVDIDQEIWAPFSSFVAAFRRAATERVKAQFLLVKASLERLLELLSQAGHSGAYENAVAQPSSNVISTLQTMAEAAESRKDSLDLLHGLESLSGNLSGLQGAVYYCKLANATLLENSSTTEILVTRVETALDALERPLRGTTTELQELLLHASALRKAAATRLAACNENLQATESRDGCRSLILGACTRTAFGVLRFLARYLSFEPQPEAVANSTAKSLPKGKCLILVAQQSLKSALAAVQGNIAYEYVSWELCVSALADCLHLSKILSEMHSSSNVDGENENMPTTSIRVSNVFWLRYLKEKDTHVPASELLFTLDRSIQALENCSPAEKTVGFLAVKCEKAASLHTELKQFTRARHVLVTAIDYHVHSGILLIASQKALTRSAQEIWVEADSPEFVLGRLLFAHARLLLKNQPDLPTSSFYDNSGLNPGERAMLLEKQYITFRDTLVPESLHTQLRQVAESVLVFYTESCHSLQRLRFISNILTFCSKNHLRPYEFLPKEALQVCTQETLDDASSSGESPLCSASLHSSVLLQWAFQTGIPSVNLLHSFVNSHTLVVESSSCWAAVSASINDPALVMSQVQSVIDFADMKGLSQIKLNALLLKRHVLERQPERDFGALASCAAQIGLQYTRMGLINSAGRALASAETHLTKTTSKALVALEVHLAFAEYLTALCSYRKAADHLTLAQRRYEADFASKEEDAARGSRLSQRSYLAHAAYVVSNLALENGDLENAFLQAKRSVKTSIRQWTVLEKLLGAKSSSPAVGGLDGKVDGLTEDLSQLSLSTEVRPKQIPNKAAAFWGHVRIHFDGLLHLSRLSAHHGSFQDAVYYGEQAKKIGEATGAGVLLRKASSTLAAYLAQAGRIEQINWPFDSSSDCLEDIDHPADTVRICLATASVHLAKDEHARGIEAVEQALMATSKIEDVDILRSPQSGKEAAHGVVIDKEASRSRERTVSKARKRGHPPITSRIRDVACGTGDCASEVASATSASIWVQRLQTEAYLMQSCLWIKSGCSENTGDLLGKVPSLMRCSASNAWYCVLQSTLMLADALQLLQSDAVYSVLAETTISHPTQRSKAKGSVRPDETTSRNPPSSDITISTCSGKKLNKKVPREHSLLKPRELITKARELLLICLSTSVSGTSSHVANQLSGLLTRLQLLSSVVLATTCPSPSPYQICCQLNAPKSLRWSREVASIGLDITLGEKSNLLAWPDVHCLDGAESPCKRSSLNQTFVQQQQQLNDSLPHSWQVITIAKSQDDSEILISRIRRDQAPFLLQIPLDRTTSEDLDEEPFSFHKAKSELHDIIASANLTAHDAKARSDKNGKKQWWAAREALDARLASLLHNMETLWLGGFRGIFSDLCHDDELLSRFSESLTRILDRQLPSRRMAGGNGEPRFQFHSHVLELFVALGNPNESVLDDSITDLLYFVVDILQFQHERNAYDEVDFDAMVLEVTDALRSYHEAAKAAQDASEQAEQAGHTILILDNALHAFPWESLPCLDGQSITRMPSMGCLQESLLRMRRNDETSPGLRIDPQKGAYILNPSSDLTSTQETFLESFSRSLANHASIVNREPSEAEFEACLRDKDLCLYFGHGSGAQFIRGRTIKRLKRCAVTFLMGCSSSKMVECGQFEPYGVPYNYLYAGSAAVVGTLWDVTDKDIDRFAMETFLNWGLLSRDDIKQNTKDSVGKTKNSKRGTKQKRDLCKRQADNAATKRVGLDDAVARARDACLLRYLNGAAPVVYGIPVYLN